MDAMTEKKVLRENDWVLLQLEDESTYLIQAKAELIFSTHKGNVNLSDAIGRPFGTVLVSNTGARVYALEPTVEDYMMKVKRQTNIIYPKEAGTILMKGNIRIGSRVIEVGTGSGALTIALADKVGNEGRVYTYERRPEFTELAKGNIERTGLSGRIEFFSRETDTAFYQREVDCVILDIPTPWEEITWVREALRPGGRLISLNPTYNQIEQMAEAMQEGGFIAIEALEILLRNILARRGKTRPVQRMVAHTEFLLFGVKRNEENEK